VWKTFSLTCWKIYMFRRRTGDARHEKNDVVIYWSKISYMKWISNNMSYWVYNSLPKFHDNSHCWNERDSKNVKDCIQWDIYKIKLLFSCERNVQSTATMMTVFFHVRCIEWWKIFFYEISEIFLFNSEDCSTDSLISRSISDILILNFIASLFFQFQSFLRFINPNEHRENFWRQSIKEPNQSSKDTST
jgi:hypothetical protein